MGRNRLWGHRPSVCAALLLTMLFLLVAVAIGQDSEPIGATANGTEGRDVPASGRYSEIRGLTDWFQRGGIFMYPLLVCSILGIGVTIERFIALQRSTSATRPLVAAVLKTVRQDGVQPARDLCRRVGSPSARVLHAGLSRIEDGELRAERAMEASGSVEVASMQRGLLWLSTIAHVAPLLGFLGTVSGMIHAFATIAGADQISARLVAGGIEEALITTEAGLSIAIPVQAFHNYFVGRIDRFIAEMEESGLDLMEVLGHPERREPETLDR